jgi:metal-responsive CopG/Arc/MetJ family transcriptional regulator
MANVTVKVSVRLPAAMLKRFDKAGQITGRSRSELACEALDKYLAEVVEKELAAVS